MQPVGVLSTAEFGTRSALRGAGYRFPDSVGAAAHAHHAAQQGGLARAVASQQTDDLAGSNAQADSVERPASLPVRAREIAELDDRCYAQRLSSS